MNNFKGTQYIGGGYDKKGCTYWEIFGRIFSIAPSRSEIFTDSENKLGLVAVNVYKDCSCLQPSILHIDNYQILFSGMIYNRSVLLSKLHNKEQISSNISDAELILNLFKVFNLEFLKDVNGQFVFVIHDTDNGKLFLVRDHMGEESLYYYLQNGIFLFASDIKQLFNFVPAKWRDLESVLYLETPIKNETSYENINILMPGSVMIYNYLNHTMQAHFYWNLPDEVAKYRKEVGQLDQNDWIKIFKNTLENAILMRVNRTPDKNLGTFMSGGQDSSFVAEYINKRTYYKIQNGYTVGFRNLEAVYNEIPWAKVIAEDVGVHHRIIEPKFEEFIKYFPLVTYLIGDVQANSAHYAEFLVYNHAFQMGDEIIMSGYGADEALGGEIRYMLVELDDDRSMFGNKLQTNSLLKQYDPLIKKLWKLSSSIPKFEKYWHLICRSNSQESNSIKDEARYQFERIKWYDNMNDAFVHQAGYLDSVFLGQNMISSGRLAKSFGLIKCCPFLDYKVQTLAYSLPVDLKLNKNDMITKVILRIISRGLVPDEITDRSNKVGFSFPYGVPPFSNYLYELAYSYKGRKNHLASLDEDRGVYDRAVRADATKELLHRMFIDKKFDIEQHLPPGELQFLGAS